VKFVRLAECHQLARQRFTEVFNHVSPAKLGVGYHVSPDKLAARIVREVKRMVTIANRASEYFIIAPQVFNGRARRRHVPESVTPVISDHHPLSVICQHGISLKTPEPFRTPICRETESL